MGGSWPGKERDGEVREEKADWDQMLLQLAVQSHIDPQVGVLRGVRAGGIMDGQTASEVDECV